jgi:hypothetical protein
MNFMHFSKHHMKQPKQQMMYSSSLFLESFAFFYVMQWHYIHTLWIAACALDLMLYLYVGYDGPDGLYDGYDQRSMRRCSQMVDDHCSRWLHTQ